MNAELSEDRLEITYSTSAYLGGTYSLTGNYQEQKIDIKLETLPKSGSEPFFITLSETSLSVQLNNDRFQDNQALTLRIYEVTTAGEVPSAWFIAPPVDAQLRACQIYSNPDAIASVVQSAGSLFEPNNYRIIYLDASASCNGVMSRITGSKVIEIDDAGQLIELDKPL